MLHLKPRIRHILGKGKAATTSATGRPTINNARPGPSENETLTIPATTALHKTDAPTVSDMTTTHWRVNSKISYGFIVGWGARACFLVPWTKRPLLADLSRSSHQSRRPSRKNHELSRQAGPGPERTLPAQAVTYTAIEPRYRSTSFGRACVTASSIISRA